MKRSEAIVHIINVLRLTGNHYCDDGRDQQDADRILKRLEVIGMLPPKFNKAKNNKLNYGDVITADFTFIDWVCEWEPEDDSSNSLDKLLNQMDNDKETQEILTKLVPDGVKLK